jgi:hypothetical protein
MKTATAFLASAATAMTMATGAMAQDQNPNYNDYTEADFYSDLAEACQPIIDSVVNETNINPEQIVDCARKLSVSSQYYYQKIKDVVRPLRITPTFANCVAEFNNMSSNLPEGSLEYKLDFSEQVAQRGYGCMDSLITEEGEVELIYGTSRADLSMMNRTLDVTYCLGAAAAMAQTSPSETVFRGKFTAEDLEQCRSINPQLEIQ